MSEQTRPRVARDQKRSTLTTLAEIVGEQSLTRDFDEQVVERRSRAVCAAVSMPEWNTYRGVVSASASARALRQRRAGARATNAAWCGWQLDTRELLQRVGRRAPFAASNGSTRAAVTPSRASPTRPAPCSLRRASAREVAQHGPPFAGGQAGAGQAPRRFALGTRAHARSLPFPDAGARAVGVECTGRSRGPGRHCRRPDPQPPPGYRTSRWHTPCARGGGG
jgi:hypothetical protein